jgi:hypothetical protein
MRDNKGRWIKGTSGNITGRPKDRKFTEVMMEKLNAINEDGTTSLERIADKVIKMAERGNIHAIRDIVNRLEGTPQQSMEINAYKNEPITLFTISGTDEDYNKLTDEEKAECITIG